MENTNTKEQENNNQPAAEPVITAKKKKSPVFFIILFVLLLGGGYYGYTKVVFNKAHEETDDAQIASNVSPVISKISGYVAEVKVKDNEFVRKGDTLIILQSKDQKILLAQAEAALGTAQSNVTATAANANAASKTINTSQAAVATANAQIEAAKVNVWRTGEDLKRYENLIKDHSITQQQFEQALAAKQSADRQLQILVEQRNQAQQQTTVVSSQSSATNKNIGVAKSVVNQRMVDVENAKVNLSYTVITAQESGFVSKVPVQSGQFLQAGAQLFSIVLSNDKWIIANFKETQLSRMVEGQKVDIKIDAFPSQTFEGVLSSFSPATGSTFALLPPDNASGNFVKVVQRLPVKIDFVQKNDSIMSKLRAGMNVAVTVNLNK